MIAWLTEAGIEVAHDWPALIDAYGGDANAGKAKVDRMILSRQCVRQVMTATHFWFLFPNVPTVGAWVELGAFYAAMTEKVRCPATMIGSGSLDSIDETIFAGLFTEPSLFELDRDALGFLQAENRASRNP